MLYLGAGFLQERTIHFAPANLLIWKLNEELVKKNVPSVISMIILTDPVIAFPQNSSVVENTTLGLVNKKQLLLVFTANNSTFNVGPQDVDIHFVALLKERTQVC